MAGKDPMERKPSGKLNIAVWIVLCAMILGLCSGCSVPFGKFVPGASHTVREENEYTDFYYRQLDNSEKKAYRRMLSGCEKRKTRILLKPISSESFYKAQGALMYDHPEYFWIRSFTIRMMADQVVQVTYPYESSCGEQFRQVEEAAKAVLRRAPSGASDYELLKYFYDTIIETVEYDSDAENGQDLRSVFLSKRSVCAGYAKAFQYLCTLAGIPCITVRGTTSDNISHAWNMVKLGDQNYWVDTTWGDPVYTQETELNNINYNYFCVPDADLFRTHSISHNIDMDQTVIENVFSFPACTDGSLNYYRTIGAYFETYQRGEVEQYLMENLKNGKFIGVELKFGSAEAYQSAMWDLFTGNRYFETILLNYRSFGVSSISYSYGFMEDCNYIVCNIHYR